VLVPSTLDLLDATPATLRATLLDLPEHCLDMPGGEGWSARDVVAHLAARQRPAFVGRVRAIVEQDRPVLPDIPDDGVRRPFERLSLPALLDDFATTRREAMQYVRSLGDANLVRTGRHETAGDVTAADIIHHIAYHDLVHLAQINAILRAPIERARGAMRMFQ
jgi:uncharacterized damage-inducible protein DinB